MPPSFPVLEKTWLDPHYYLEIPVQATGTLQNTVTFLAVKNGLLGLPQNPWTCKGSSDSTTAGMDGVDRLTDTTKIVNNAAGVHSWFVFRNVDGLELLFDWGVSGGAYAAKLQMSVGAGFTGGSTTVTPTATDQELVEPTAAGGGTSRWLWDGTSTTARLHLHIMHTTDGKNTMLFIMHAGICQSIWIMGRASDPVPGWTHPLVCYIEGCFNIDTSTIQAYDHLLTRASVMSHVDTRSLAMRVTYPGWQGTTAPAIHTLREANTGNWQCWSMGLICVTAGALGRHGRLTDVWRMPASVPSGWIFRPDDSSVALINFGSYLVPYSKTMVPLVI